jgi:hypothetical protein
MHTTTNQVITLKTTRPECRTGVIALMCFPLRDSLQSNLRSVETKLKELEATDASEARGGTEIELAVRRVTRYGIVTLLLAVDGRIKSPLLTIERRNSILPGVAFVNCGILFLDSKGNHHETKRAFPRDIRSNVAINSPICTFIVLNLSCKHHESAVAAVDVNPTTAISREMGKGRVACQRSSSSWKVISKFAVKCASH